MSAEENKATVRRLLEELYDKRNVDIFDEVYAADYKGYIPRSTLESPEAAKQFNLAKDKAFPVGSGPGKNLYPPLNQR